jgi:hypothetical protein
MSDVKYTGIAYVANGGEIGHLLLDVRLPNARIESDESLTAYVFEFMAAPGLLASDVHPDLTFLDGGLLIGGVSVAASPLPE